MNCPTCQKDYHPQEGPQCHECFTAGEKEHEPSAAPSGSALLTDSERREVADILGRRANELASFREDIEKATATKFNGWPGCIDLAVEREMTRLRGLQAKIKPAPKSYED